MDLVEMDLGTDAVTEILQAALPVAPWMAEHTLRLPGTTPIAPSHWLVRDEVFAPQMQLRDRLIATRPEAVHAMTGDCRPAAEELLALVLSHLGGAAGFARDGDALRRPDGVSVPLDGPPLIAAGRLVQEDLVILEKPAGGDEHLMTGAICCFPSNWTLAEKFGKSLARIHLPVESYDESIARRVQRMFDGLRAEQPLMRANLLIYGKTDLHNPRHEFDRHRPAPGDTRFIRVERQTFMRLERSRAVVFGIHTFMVRPDALTPDQRARLDLVRPGALG